MIFKDKSKISCLIIEDNPGDYLLMRDYLDEKFLQAEVSHVKTLRHAQEILARDKSFDIILLDIGLPDLDGIPVIKAIASITYTTPIIVVTGHEKFDFSQGAFDLGISDYLLKDDLTPEVLYKSIKFSLERDRFNRSLRESERKYSQLFQKSPIPKIIIRKDLSLYDFNHSAIKQFGAKLHLSESIVDLVVSAQQEETKLFLSNLEMHEQKMLTRLMNKTKQVLIFEMKFSLTGLGDDFYAIVSLVDLTDNVKKTEKIERQVQRLKEIAWIQSHVVRAPLARIMGLADLIKEDALEPDELHEFMQLILDSCNELDEIIRDITFKTKDF